MTQREAKRRACSIAADVLFNVFFEVGEYLDRFEGEDYDRVKRSAEELIAELYRRAAEGGQQG